jgi:hypothetical protein
MDNEKNRAGKSPPSIAHKGAPTPLPSPRKKRSLVEHTITWNVIALLLVAALNELRAQSGYKQSLAAVEATLIDKVPEEPPTLSDARQLMTLWPGERRGRIEEFEVQGGEIKGVDTSGRVKDHEVVFFRWWSPFKRYEILCGVGSIDEANPRMTYIGTRQPAFGDEPEFIAWTTVKQPPAPPPNETENQ